MLSKHNGLYSVRDTFQYYDEAVKRDEENGIYFYAFANENLRSNYGYGIVGDFSYLDEKMIFKKAFIPFAGTPIANVLNKGQMMKEFTVFIDEGKHWYGYY